MRISTSSSSIPKAADRRSRSSMPEASTWPCRTGFLARSAPPFALRQLQEGRIAIIARASEATELRDQTIRVNIAGVGALARKRDAITRLMQVYDKAIAWSYANPKAIDYFAESAKVPRDVA